MTTAGARDAVGCSSQPAHLQPSELGTKQYWDELYASELRNHAADPRDEGTAWFDDSRAEAKTVAFLEAQARPRAAGQEHPEQQQQQHDEPALSKAATSFLDLGCGNGALLLALRGAGWRGPMLGVDYSAASVELARRVARGRREGQAVGDEDDDDEEVVEEEEEEEGEQEEGGKEVKDGLREEESTAADPPPDIDFRVWDVLTGPLDAVRPAPEDSSSSPWPGWDVVLDKGTFDAISLSGATDAAGRRECEGYRARVLACLRPGGAFVVTSCNWTEAELRAWMEDEGDVAAGQPSRLELVGKVTYRSFSFGGASGQTICTLCFVKRSRAEESKSGGRRA